METMNKITKNEFKKNHTMHYRVREKVVWSNNMIAEIIVYRNHKDIDVRNEDGYVIEHTTYQSFTQRSCSRPDKKPVIWHQHLPIYNYMITVFRSLVHTKTLIFAIRLISYS